eukprot:SM000101S09281  [mRNA]  locus=s101:310714:313080:- [translate_table: standard]
MEAEVASAAGMPVHSQKVLLGLLGASLVAAGRLACNPFGGAAACVPLAADSPLLRQCPHAHGAVDCGFRAEALEEQADDPNDALRQRLADEGYPACPACLDALHEFWCGQTVPACGTFDHVLTEALPVVDEVATQHLQLKEALQSHVPRMLEGASLGLPCREMCHHITNTCSCGINTTFGAVMTSLERKQRAQLQEASAEYRTNMSRKTARTFFYDVWDKDVCDLFASKDFPGFIGVCHVPQEGADKCSWCQGRDWQRKRPQDIQEQIVAQIAQTVSGMMQAGLQQLLSAAGGASGNKNNNDVAFDWQSEQATDPKRRGGGGGGGAGMVFLLLLVVVASVAVGGGAVYFFQQGRDNSQSLIEAVLGRLGYSSLVDREPASASL